MARPSLFLLAAMLCAAATAAPATARERVPAAAVPVTDTLRLSLEDAVSRALAGGEEMRIAGSAVLEANGRVREALANALPTVKASLTYDRKLQSIFGAMSDDTLLASIFENSPFAAANAWTGELTGSWLAYSSGKTSAALRGARAVHRSAAAAEAEAAAQVVYAVRQAYFEAAYQGQLIAIAEDGLAQARAHQAEVVLRRGQGTRSEYELLRAEVDAANQEPALVAARHGLDVALLSLKRLVNVPLEQPLGLTTPLDFETAGVPVPAEGLDGPVQRHALAAAEADVAAYEQLLRVQRGLSWPDLTVQSTFQQQAFPQNTFPSRSMFRRNWDVSLKLEMPITGFRNGGLVEQARAQLERARATRDRLRRQTEVDLAEAKAELARTLAVLAARRETSRQARRAQELANVRFTNGLSTQLEVSDARLQFQTSEVNQVLAARDYRVALARLELVLGRPLRLEPRPLDTITSMRPSQGTSP